MGKATLADLATTQDGKDLLRRRSIKEVIVYDDGATDCERLPSNSTLYIVLSALLEDHKEPLLLAGKFPSLTGHVTSPLASLPSIGVGVRKTLTNSSAHRCRYDTKDTPRWLITTS